MKALVTGGAGFIGSHLVELLLARGHQVLVCDNLKSGRLKNLAQAKKSSLFSFEQVDLEEAERLLPLTEGVDWVFHIAGLADGIPSVKNPRDYYEANVTGTFNILEASRKAHVKRFIYAASSSCYGIPTSFPTKESDKIALHYPYALTKYLGEELVLHWGEVYHLPVISLRLFNVYGPRSRTTGSYGAVFGVFLAQKIHKKPYTVVGNGRQSRDFVYVADVAEAFYKAAESSVTQEIFNVGSGRKETINHIVELLGGENVVYLPKRPGEPDCTWADISKIEKKLGWVPRVSFEEGVKHLLNSLEDYQDAPLWEPETIEKATAEWFQHLGEVCSNKK